MKIAVTGAQGQLGQCLQQIAADYPYISFSFFSSSEWDITNEALTAATINELQPDVVINAAAYTAVDRAESEVDKAFLVNATAVEYLARHCRFTGTKLIHVSTDYVFDGEANEPYKEDYEVNPQGIYGKSKLQGEIAALSANPNTMVVRTSWVYSKYGHNFVKTMLRLMSERPLLKVVNDQIGCPTYAPDLAKALVQLAITPSAAPGIYHYSNSGVISWFQFALAIKALANKTTQVEPIPTSDYPTPAKRPAWSVLDCSKIARIEGIEIIAWQESLRKCITELEIRV